jgi:hypothetical protein
MLARARLSWSDVLPRDEGPLQLSITGKGGKVRQVLLREQPLLVIAARRRRRQ